MKVDLNRSVVLLGKDSLITMTETNKGDELSNGLFILTPKSFTRKMTLVIRFIKYLFSENTKHFYKK